MNTFLLTVATILVLLLGALFAGPYFVDWTAYRAEFQDKASQVLGRDVRIGGDVRVRFLPTPYLHLENVRVADASGRFDTPLARVDSYTLYLSVPPLLRGQIDAREMTLVNPRVRLAIDENGEGNWRGLSFSPAGLSLDASDISLNSVNITGGQFRYLNPRGDELASLRGLSGNMSATTLAGPYQFRGTVTSETAPEPVEVRLRTGAYEAGRGLKFKVTVEPPKDAAGRQLYTLEGDILPGGVATSAASGATRDDTWRVEGGLTGRIPTRKGSPSLDLKATLVADARSVRMDQLALSFESDGRPQLISGSGRFNWAGDRIIALDLSSRWIDLDLITGGPGETIAPMRRLAGLVDGLRTALPGDRRIGVETTLKIDQVKLAGAAVETLDLTAKRANGVIEITKLSAGLPGAATADVSGRLSLATPEKPGFNGRMVAHGANVQTLVAWLAPDLGAKAADIDGHFAIEAGVTLSNGSVQLSDASGELGSDPFQLDFSHRYEDTPLTRIKLRSDRLDLRTMAPSGLGLKALAQQFGLVAIERDGPGGDALPIAALFGPGSAVFDVAVGRVLLPGETLFDLASRGRLEENQLVIDDVTLFTRDGVELRLDGAVENVRDEPTGELRYTLGATDRAALSELAREAGLEQDGALKARLIDSLLPLRITGTVGFGKRGVGTLDLSSDGRAGESRILALVRHDGIVEELSESLLDISVSLQNRQPDVLVRQLMPAGRRDEIVFDTDAVTSSDPLTGEARGVLTFRLNGRLTDGLSAVAALDAGALRARFAGTVGLVEEQLGAEGELALEAGRTDHVLALFDQETSIFDASDPFRAEGRIAAQAQTVRMAELSLRSGATAVNGETTLTFDTPTRVNAVLGISKANAGDLLSAILGDEVAIDPLSGEVRTSSAGLDATLASDAADPATAEAGGATQLADDATSGGPSDGWLSPRSFDFSALDDLSGRVRLAIDDLVFTDGIAVSSAVLDAQLGPQGIELSGFSADALGGQLTAKGALERVPAGAQLTLSSHMQGVELASLGRMPPTDEDGVAGALDANASEDASSTTPSTGLDRAGSGPLNGTAAFRLDASGRGLSPRGLAAVLNGRGVIEVSEGSLDGMAPDAVSNAADQVLESTAPVSPDVLSGLLQTEFRRGRLDFVPLAVPFRLRDGAVRLSNVKLDTPAATVSMTTLIDLGRLALDSEWRVAAKAEQGSRDARALPPIRMVHTAELTKLNALTTRIDSGLLARELTVRQLEADAERLDGQTVAAIEPELRGTTLDTLDNDVGVSEGASQLESPVSDDATDSASSDGTSPSDAATPEAGISEPVLVEPLSIPDLRAEDFPQPNVSLPVAPTDGERFPQRGGTWGTVLSSPLAPLPGAIGIDGSEVVEGRSTRALGSTTFTDDGTPPDASGSTSGTAGRAQRTRAQTQQRQRQRARRAPAASSAFSRE